MSTYLSAMAASFNLNTVEQATVERLVKIHGECTLYNKPDRTIEVRLADPQLLEEDGDKELNSRHLYVNVTKYVRQGHARAAYCVKTGRTWNIDDLLSMQPIEQRAGLTKPHKRKITGFGQGVKLIHDDRGNLTPPEPGEVIALNQLGDDHPAIRYITSRGLEASALVKQFRAGYCQKANPDIQPYRIPGGLCPAPQGRIIMFADMGGVQVGWQARRLELWCDDQLHLWNPWRDEWANVACRDEAGINVYARYRGSYIGMPENAVLDRKYFNAPGMKVSETLIGLDAAVKWRHDVGIPTLGLVEGVFDAARLGAPFVGMMGLTIKQGQVAKLIGQGFKRVVYICDQDENSENAERTRKSMKLLEPHFDVQEIMLPSGVKDAAELNDDQRNDILDEAGLLVE